MWAILGIVKEKLKDWTTKATKPKPQKIEPQRRKVREEKRFNHKGHKEAGRSQGNGII